MINISINQFIEDLASLSPLTCEYEMNIISINMNIAILKKNTSIVNSRKPDNNLNKFLNILDTSTKEIYSKYDVSKEHIGNYMLLIKMPKLTNEQIKEYKSKLQKINLQKINNLIDIMYLTDNIINQYNNCKNLYKYEYILSNELCISNILNIKKYLYKYTKDMCSEIEDENTAIEIIKRLNSFDKI